MFGIVGGVLADNPRPAPIADGGSRSPCSSPLRHSPALTIAGRMSPVLLLMFTFVIGTGSVLVTPPTSRSCRSSSRTGQIPAAAQLSFHQRQPRQGYRARDRRAPDRVHRGRGRLCIDAGDVPCLRRRGRSLAAGPGHDPADPRAIRVGTSAGGRYVRYAPVVPPDFAPGGALSCSRRARFGRCSPSSRAAAFGLGPAGTGCCSVPRGRGHRRCLRAIEGTRPDCRRMPSSA